ncbi:hypothetical protein [Rickettsia endosymbiont of Culicoides newsteadi]|uniref:hypothetical protein n=1 Tax=Rickettsia endosymbiont of Culicoides newsteadi TaxID=1961830 RepID=UPI0012FF7CF7|nr:hypothetical protein [Rickettsia endosymbiont of Culicoides newsteadi]
MLGVVRESEEYFTNKLAMLNVEEYDKSQLETIRNQISNNENPTTIVSVDYYGIESIIN